ncbi:MAG: hypothetical protein ABIQ86_02020 [Steroidobacteraceae bacterium]
MSARSACGTLLSALLTGLTLAAAPATTPRLSDGHPDLNGIWDNGGGIDFLQPQQRADGSLCVSGCAPAVARTPATAAPAPAAVRQAPERPRYLPQFAARVEDLRKRQQKEDGVLRCQPPGVPRIGPPDKIVQTAREVVFLYEDVSGPFFRIVPLRTGVRRADDSESYLGDATGRWDGDTLVVETTNFNELTWLTDDGAFHSPALKVTEWLTRRGNEIDYRFRVDDPTVLAEPWQPRPRRLVLSDVEMAEPAPCVEQDLSNMVDDTFHANPR